MFDGWIILTLLWTRQFFVSYSFSSFDRIQIIAIQNLTLDYNPEWHSQSSTHPKWHSQRHSGCVAPSFSQDIETEDAEYFERPPTPKHKTCRLSAVGDMK